MLTSATEDREAQAWHHIWKLKGPGRLNLFLWHLRYGVLPTVAFLRRRGIVSDVICSLCHRTAIGELHELRDCRRSTEVWHILVGRDRWGSFFHSASAKEWLDSNLATSTVQASGWACVFKEAAYSIWRSRNEVIHNRKQKKAPPWIFASEVLTQVRLTLIAVGVDTRDFDVYDT